MIQEETPTSVVEPTRADSLTGVGNLQPKWSRPLHELLMAFDYAFSMRVDTWQFAIGIGELRMAGLSDSDCRWLVSAGYAEHAQEMTRTEDAVRRFQPVHNLSFFDRSCFVFTARGADFARDSLDWLAAHLCDDQQVASQAFAPPTDVEVLVPSWDRERHELRLGGHMVKQFKWIAANQEMILSAFEEEGWPIRIDDPLPPRPEQDSKRRLHDTIKCLNRNQRQRLIHFGGDGTGEGVVWSLVPSVVPYDG